MCALSPCGLLDTLFPPPDFGGSLSSPPAGAAPITQALCASRQMVSSAGGASWLAGVGKSM